MKKLMLLATTLVCASAFASTIQNAEYYVLDTWMGEYPMGFQISKDVKVPSVDSVNNPMVVGSCTLKAKTVIHPWAKKTKADFASLTGIAKYQATKNFELTKSQQETIQVKVGDVITELSYLAEGNCLMNVNGVQFDDACMDPKAGLVKQISASPFPTREFFKTTCKEGNSAWIAADSLRSLSDDSNSGVTAAEILEYGKVKEP